jgi:hypothetical protein
LTSSPVANGQQLGQPNGIKNRIKNMALSLRTALAAVALSAFVFSGTLPAAADSLNIGISAKKGTKEAKKLGLVNTILGVAMTGKGGKKGGCNRATTGQFGNNHKLNVSQKGCGNDIGVIQVGNGANTTVNQKDGDVGLNLGVGLD